MANTGGPSQGTTMQEVDGCRLLHFHPNNDKKQGNGDVADERPHRANCHGELWALQWQQHRQRSAWKGVALHWQQRQNAKVRAQTEQAVMANGGLYNCNGTGSGHRQ